MNKVTLFNFLKSDLYRCMSNKKWLLCIISISILIIIPGYRMTDLPFNVLGIVNFGVYSDYFLLMLVVCTLPFATSITEDREYKYYRSVVMRGKIKQYILSKMLVSFLSAFLVVFLGMSVCILILQVFFPMAPLSEFLESAELPFVYLYKKHQYWLFFSLIFTKYGLGAGLFVQTSLLVSLFVKNKLMVYVAPLCLFYINTYLLPIIPFSLPSFYFLHYYSYIQNDFYSFISTILVTIILFFVFFHVILIRFKKVIEND